MSERNTHSIIIKDPERAELGAANGSELRSGHLAKSEDSGVDDALQSMRADADPNLPEERQQPTLPTEFRSTERQRQIAGLPEMDRRRIAHDVMSNAVERSRGNPSDRVVVGAAAAMAPALQVTDVHYLVSVDRPARDGSEIRVWYHDRNGDPLYDDMGGEPIATFKFNLSKGTITQFEDRSEGQGALQAAEALERAIASGQFSETDKEIFRKLASLPLRRVTSERDRREQIRDRKASRKYLLSPDGRRELGEFKDSLRSALNIPETDEVKVKARVLEAPDLLRLRVWHGPVARTQELGGAYFINCDLRSGKANVTKMAYEPLEP